MERGLGSVRPDQVRANEARWEQARRVLSTKGSRLTVAALAIGHSSRMEMNMMASLRPVEHCMTAHGRDEIFMRSNPKIAKDRLRLTAEYRQRTSVLARPEREIHRTQVRDNGQLQGS